MTERLKAVAPAKVNLSLSITGKRPDGYHLLESLVVFTEFGDEVAVTPAERFSLHIDGEFADQCGNLEDNLILRAAQRMAEAYHISSGAEMLLTKHIPVGAGLGGGSSDAAAVVRLLSQLWDVSWDAAAMAELLLPLGADMPACTHARPLWVRGIGDDIEVLLDDLPDMGAMLLVNPRQKLDTKQVYQGSAAATHSSRAYAGEPIKEYVLHAENDLTASAIALCPELADVLAALRAQPNLLLARMSGSGASCFGFYKDIASAIVAEQSIKAKYQEWWVKVTTIW